MGAAKNNCCVVARYFYTFLNTSHLNVSRFKCFASFMVLEVALNFNSLPDLVEFKIFSEENQVQDTRAEFFLLYCLRLCNSPPSCISVNIISVKSSTT